MKPELILQSDVLDIVFENKNKAYGAYELRRYYNKRLKQSMFVTFLLVTVFAFLQSWKIPHRKGSIAFDNLDSLKLMEMKLKPDEPIEKPKEKIIQPKKLAEIKYENFVVKPDDEVKDTLPTIEAICSKSISNRNVDGDIVPPEDVIKPSSNGNNINVTTTEVEEEIRPVHFAEVMPEFPGGMDAFLKFMQRNLKQPENMEDAEKLVVVAEFVVDAEGNISDLKISQHARADPDAEVIRVIKKMPQWKPGIQNGRKVPVFCKLPVTFVASE